MSGDIDGFRTELRVVRGLAESTVQIYAQESENLLAYLKTKHVTVRSASREVLLEWRESLNTRADAGISLAVTAARQFFAYLGIAERFPAFQIRIKTQESTDVPTVGQVLAMRELLKKPITDPRAVPALTRQAIFEALAGSALRIGALLSLRKKHLHLEGSKPYIMVVAGESQCKGKHAGAVPISPYSARVLASYLASKCLSDDDLVFDLSESVVRKILNEIAPEGLHMKPHALRHYCCSMTYFRNYDGGRNDVIWCRDMAGHSSISTTDVYLKMARRVVTDDASWERWAHGEAS